MNNINNILSSKYSLIILIVIAFIYNIIVYRNKIILTLMFFITLYFMNLYNIQEKLNNYNFMTNKEIKEKHMTEIIDKEVYLTNNKNIYIDDANLYKIYKKPTDYYFLRNNKFLEEIIYNMRFIEKYDKGDFIKMIIYMDAFLKTYYYIINDRYDHTYIDILVDIRLELLNIMNNFMIDAPMFTKNKKNRLDKLINNNLLKTQSYTFKKLKNISNKYPHFNHKNPKGVTNNLYDNYNIII